MVKCERFEGKRMSKNKSQIWDVLVIGAGASGMMAAITAARRGKRVLLLEHMDKPGKKLLATGNGRCNFTNAKMSPDCFYGDRELAETVLGIFGKDDTLAFFREIGIYPKEKNGYYYPNSMQASSVTEALVAELSRWNVNLMTGTDLQMLEVNRTGFTAHTTNGNYRGCNVILATGLRAASKLGSDGSVFPILKELGHRFRPVLPALCGFRAEGMDFKKVSGVRCDANLTLSIDDRLQQSERGELQLADYGISGIPVFQISSPGARALHDKKNVCVIINFLPDLTLREVTEELTRRFRRERDPRSVADSLCGLLNHKLIPILLHRAKINVHQKCEQVDNMQINRLADAIHEYPVTLSAVRDFAYAQVCTGGVRTEEIDIATLSSRLVPGLYFAGELLDVDGICGGYNLQWAWSSGFVAGSSVE
jgi:hypothetical protein